MPLEWMSSFITSVCEYCNADICAFKPIHVQRKDDEMPIIPCVKMIKRLSFHYTLDCEEFYRFDVREESAFRHPCAGQELVSRFECQRLDLIRQMRQTTHALQTLLTLAGL